MPSSITQAFVKQYESEVHDAYQRTKAGLRGAVRTKTGVVGSTARFQKIGKGIAGTKTRHGTVPVMNVDHSYVDVTLEDHYAGDWFDKLDEAKINIDEKGALVRAGSYALARKTDDIIHTALATGTLSTVVGTTGMTTAKIEAALAEMGDRDVPIDDGQMFGLLGWQEWYELMDDEKFSSADYVPESERPYGGKGLFSKSFMGVFWMPSSIIQPDGSDHTTNFIWHKSAVGHAIGVDVNVDITWHGDRASHFINHMMSQGAVKIDDNGIQKIVADRSP